MNWFFDTCCGGDCNDTNKDCTPSKCDNCLMVEPATIDCVDGLPQCDGSSSKDVEIKVHNCETYDIVFTDVDDGITYELNDNIVTITADADPEVAVPGKFYNMRGYVKCPATGRSVQFIVIACVNNPCSTVVCGENKTCDKCTGLCVDLEADLSAGIQDASGQADMVAQ